MDDLPHVVVHQPWLGGWGWTLGALFWGATLIYCLLRDHEERHIWLFVILFLNVVGAAVYLVVRVVPVLALGERLLSRSRRNREIARTEAELVHLGDRPHLLARLGVL